MSLGESVEGYPELHHDLFVLNTVHLYVPAWILVDVEWVNDAERKLVGLAFSCKSTRLLDRDDLVGWFKLI